MKMAQEDENFKKGQKYQHDNELKSQEDIEVVNKQDKAQKFKQFSSIEYMGIAQVLFQLGNYKDALQLYDNALKLDPNNLECLEKKVSLLNGLKRYEEVIQVFDQLIELDPNHSLYYYFKAQTLIRLDQYDEALKMYDNAIEMEPNNPFYYTDKGNLLTGLERFKEAYQLFDKVLEMDPKTVVEMIPQLRFGLPCFCEKLNQQ